MELSPSCKSDSLFSKAALEAAVLCLVCTGSVDGPGHLTGTGTSKMEVEGGGYAWGGLNATWRLWKSLCKIQVFMLEGLRHWAGLCSWLGGSDLAAGPWLGVTHSFALFLGA